MRKHLDKTFRAAMLGLFVLASSAFGQSVGLPAPRLLTTMPMGGKAGTTLDVTISGEHLEDIGDLSFSDSRIVAKPKTGADGKPVANAYVVTIAPDCPEGVYEARVMTRLGISSTRVFSVGTLDEVTETKPNSTLATAVEMPVNAVCNGVVADRSIDCLSFQAKKGQRLTIDCATRGIDSKLNATVIVANSAGRDLLVERRGGVLEFPVPADGKYVIKIHELTYKGGPAFFYRLALRERPEGSPVLGQPSTRPVNAFSWPPTGLAMKPASEEKEAEGQTRAIQKIALPADIAGTFFPAADVDVFDFEAKKGEEWWVEVASERFGRPTDPSVIVQRVSKTKSADGAEVESLTDVVEFNDVPSPVKVSSNGYAYDGPPYNAGTSDVLGKLAIPQDGTYRLQLTDLFGGTRSDPNNRYRLVIRKAAPDFALVAWAIHMELRNGDRNALSKPIALRGGATMALEVIAFRRDGFDGPIDIAMEGLPSGVTASGLKIPQGQSRGLMLITAAPDAPRGYANAKFVGRAEINGELTQRPVSLASVAWPIPDSWGEIPSPRLVADVPVSVSGVDAAPITIAPKSAKIEAKVGQKLTIPLSVVKRSEFSGDKMQMKAIGAGFERVPGFDLALNKDTAEVTIDLATLKTPPGEYVVAFIGGAVAKYRHRPDLAVAAEGEAKKAVDEAAALEVELKKIEELAKAAQPEKKPEAEKAVASMGGRMKSARENAAKAQAKMKQAKDASQPRDIADIVVSEPIVIHVQPAESK
jgi:hypothetical protein